MLRFWIIPSQLPIVVVFLLSQLAIAQQDPFKSTDSSNPFGNAEKKESDNPFGNRPTKDSPTKLIEDLRAQAFQKDARIANLNMRLRENQVTIESLKQKLNFIEDQNKILEKKVGEKNYQHQAILEKLLLSTELDQKVLGLQHLDDCRNLYKPDEMPIDIGKPAILKTIAELAESENDSLRNQAARILFNCRQDDAVRRGIQFGPNWMPIEWVNTDAKTIRIFRAFNERINFQYEECPLHEVLDEIKIRFQFNIRLGSELDKEKFKLITHSSRDQTLDVAFGNLLRKIGLGYCISDQEVVLRKLADPSLKVARTYNIRRLKKDLPEMKAIQNLIESSLGSQEVDFIPIDNHVFVAKTDERNQKKISKLLGTLAPPADW
ncbi:MAG: hypothetical protein AAF623_20005 [Planctomycetota bacterium]